jgi:hypothetical protein
VDWIDLARDKDHWRGIMNAVMDIRAPLRAGNFLIS